jgi:hypothetical protein
MPLRPERLFKGDLVGDGVRFRMLNERGVLITCRVNRDVLEADQNRAINFDEQAPVFCLLRSDIERICSEKYDAGALDHGEVVVTAADIRSADTPERRFLAERHPHLRK